MSDTASSDEEIVEVDDYDKEAQDDHDDDNDDDEDDDESISELGSWRQVHAQLVEAVSIAREAVAAKKLQRRFWLEDICANLTEDGKLTATSVWKRPVPPKKTVKKKKKKVKPEPKPKKKAPAKKKKDTEDADDDGPKKKKIRLTLKRKPKSPSPPPEPVQDLDDEETSEEEEEDDESEAGTNMEYQRDASGGHTADYANAAHWGGGHHTGFLVRNDNCYMRVEVSAAGY
jgi:hypothetical protein